MINVRFVLLNVILVLLVWGFGWLIYEFGGLYPVVSVDAWQNIMLIIVGVCLCCVMVLGMKPKKLHEESIPVHEEPHVKKPKPSRKKQAPKKSKKVLRDEIKKLSDELLETKPNSKKRKELMQKIMELEGKPKK